MKSLTFVAGLILVGMLCCCSNSTTISSLKELPPVPAGKARVVLVFENSPSLWKIAPIYVAIDGRPVEQINLKMALCADIASGRHILSCEQAKTVGVGAGLSVTFLPGQARYFHARARHRLDRSGIDFDIYDLVVNEIDACNAEKLIQMGK